jgi:hypothetical protein
MTTLFATTGDNLDLAYLNLRARKHRSERDIAEALESMWAQYSPYADRRFVQAFARDPDARFWEMFIGCALLNAGKTLLLTEDRPRKGGHPDLCIVDGSRRIWIEAIAPDRGQLDDDRVPEIAPINRGGHVAAQPIRQIHLRISSALWTKTKAFRTYRDQGIIAESEPCVVAIGAGRFATYAQGIGFPLAVSAVFPIGNQFVRVDRSTLEIVEHGFQPSNTIERATGDDIPRSAFVDPNFHDISGLIWSRVSIGNMRRAIPPLSFIHNRFAATECLGDMGYGTASSLQL